ncbi:MAG: polysaccharide deacetylase family protein [Minisyncoccia bacterium]
MTLSRSLFAVLVLSAFLFTLSFATSAHAQSANLIQNPGFETAGTGGNPASWTKTFWGTPTPTFAYPVAGRSGNGTQVTFSANSNGDARWQHAPVTVTAGTQYTYSIWYKSTAATEINMEFANSTGGQITYGWLANLPASGDRWLQYTGSFTVPTGKTRATVFQLLDKTGTLIIDDVSLTSGSTQPPPPPPTAPTLTLSANPTTITTGQSSTLTWSTTNATSCTAFGGWTGTKATSGSQAVTPTANTTYSLSCSGASGTTPAQQSVTVSVTAAPPPPPGGFSEGMVSLTFDDSWTSQYANVLPVLQTANLKGTFYLTTEPVQGGWDGFMTPNQVKDIGNKGHEIAGHTVTHVDLTTVGQTRVRNEVRNSKTYLQQLTGKTVTSFAYPYGSANTTVKTILRNEGYTNARGVQYESLNTATTDKYELKSMCVETSNSIAEIKAQIDTAKANKQWFVLCIHEVQNNGDQYTMTPAKFQEIVDYIKSTGIKVVTMKEGRALMP